MALHIALDKTKSKKPNLILTKKTYADGDLFAMGETSEIDPLITNRKNNIFNTDLDNGKSLATTMVDLINMEIKAKPEKVGLPVSVVELSSNRQPYWIYKGVCK